MKRYCLFMAIVFSLVGCVDKAKNLNYYFDPVNGKNENAGTSPEEPFRNLSTIKTLPIKPGDSILLKSGAVFEEHFYVSAKGAAEKPVVIGKYGGTKKPHVK